MMKQRSSPCLVGWIGRVVTQGVAEPLYYFAAAHLAAEAKRLIKEQVRVRDEQVELVKSVTVSNAAFKPSDVRQIKRP